MPAATDTSQDFLALADEYSALKFGEFTLKSGRVSPYFFNMGEIASGAGMKRLAAGYAAALAASGIAYDSLFGPAYKGIPLVATVACALADHGRDVPFTYNRKEAKDHGEGGTLVGAPLGRRVVIVDDVITAGTAVREAIDLIRAAGSEVAGVLIALDRRERGSDDRSPLAALAEDEGIPTTAVATLDDVIIYAERAGLDIDTRLAVQAYRDAYGVR
ncbi:orotate phosphoribosyltransferase [Salinisphaera orenii MK-B5]|uniref:Orotate phosphoribosyltransferase n=1 Tax=Salinisphaera orenii MK-B5 TaxID=856730 RepID=A0A423PVS1_9GAMM|nr:orotate phosphoribosyltransferase [Salinisphaera orenii]ROO29708.1 orotate phosphoribosyltransferase [Salinisphaera orenii MK-B5]